jgi:hypothetical protein
MAGDIFALNAGWSSLKFSLWHRETSTELSELFRGEIEKIGTAPHLGYGDLAVTRSPRRTSASSAIPARPAFAALRWR